MKKDKAQLPKETRFFAGSGIHPAWGQLIPVPFPNNKQTVAGSDAPFRAEEKPVAAYTELIQRETRLEDLVIDLFAGSGTLAEAALLTCRPAFISDKDEKALPVITARASSVVR